MKSIGAKRRNEICGYKPKTSSKKQKNTKYFGAKRKKTSSKNEKNENGFSISKQKPTLNLEKHKKLCLNKRGLFFPLGKIDIVP